MIYLIAFLGVAFHLLMKYRDSYTKKEVFEFKKHLIFSAMSVVTAFLIVYFRKDLSLWLTGVGMDIDFDNKLVIFLLSYFSDSIWKNIESTGANKLGVKDGNE